MVVFPRTGEQIDVFAVNILHIIPTLTAAAGPTILCVEVCDRLADDGIPVTILHGNIHGGEGRRSKNSNVRRVQQWKDIASDGQCADLVHVHALWSLLAHQGVVYARKHRIPYVISAHGMLAPWALKHKWLKKKIAWWFYQKHDLEGAEMFHVTAESEIKWLRDLGFRQPCVLAPLGSDLPELNYAETRRRRDVKTLLFVGRIYPVKGLVNLVNAWARLKESVNSKPLSVNGNPKTQPKTAHDSRLTVHGNPWRLVLAGPDQAGHKAELLAEAEKLGLSVADISVNQLIGQSANQPLPPDILFTGPVYGADKDAVYRLADLFVLPSFTENFGVVVADALSYGMPVITTKGTPWAELEGEGSSAACAAGSKVQSRLTPLVQGMSEGLAHGDINDRSTSAFIPHPPSFAANGCCGWWIDIGVEPLVEALREAMGLSDEERRTMGENGRKLVESKYTWPVVAERMKKAYESVLSLKGREPGGLWSWF